MRTITDITGLLEQFEKKYNYRVVGCDQQSEAWFKMKLGVLSASKASAIVAKKESMTRLTYMVQLVAQVCTGMQPEIKAVALDWGNQYEGAARSFYELQKGTPIVRVPFVFFDDNFREGCSPDGFPTSTKGAEIKCPFASENFVKFVAAGEFDSDWKWQCQENMRCTGATSWDFGMYDPRQPKILMKWEPIERDEKSQKTLADAVPQFISDMDKMCEKMGVKFGDQWLRLKG
jgi:hypothetical protein